MGNATVAKITVGQNLPEIFTNRIPLLAYETIEKQVALDTRLSVREYLIYAFLEKRPQFSSGQFRNMISNTLSEELWNRGDYYKRELYNENSA